MQEGFFNSIMGISNPEGETNYWSYWSWNGREWVFKETGAGDSTVYPGTIEAWYFTSWEEFPSFPPVFIPDANSICNASILKVYGDQPYLDYNDLYEFVIQEVNPPLSLEEEEPAETETAAPAAPEPTKVEEVKETPPQDGLTTEKEETEPLSNIPLLIIVAVGGVILVVVIFLVIKKQK
jgi:hypothetical protein